jgi:outer membrane protein insertion porin family/translocation and assembly module TamA
MRRRRVLWRVLCWIALAGPAVSGCVEGEGGVRLTALTIEGAHAVTTKEIREVLATRPSGRLPWSEKVTFDRAAFEADLERIRRFYQDRGYPDARVEHVEVTFNEARDAVKAVIRIAEGEPIKIAGASFVGLDALTPDVLNGVNRSAVDSEKVRDRAAVAALRQRILDLLRDHGYAYAKVDASEKDVGNNHVALTFTAAPGPPTTFGPIKVVGAEQLEDRIILRQLVLQPGQSYTQRQITQSQRRLASLDILRFSNVDAKPPVEGQPTAIPVTVTVAEDKTHRLELGAGYGTEDRVRGSIDWSHLNFLGDARRLTLSGKFSSIDRGARATFSQPYFLAHGVSLDASAVDWWTGERVYTSTTYGGRIGLSYRLRGRGRSETRGGAGRPGDRIRLSYVDEFLRYTVRPEVLADLGNVDQLLALGLDPVSGRGRGTKTAVAADFEHVATDNAADPRVGWTTTLHGEVANPALGGTFRYNQVLGEARTYVPIGATVVATRVRAGSIAARSDTDVPFSDRFFLGGASSLRGWSRYQVAPLTNGIPIGGRTMVEMALEWRVPLKGPIGAVAFFDTGNVWARSFAATTGGFRSDAGVGLRYRTPVGLLRGDAAFQLNPIEGLMANGQPALRTWRLHVSIGQAF